MGLSAELEKILDMGIALIGEKDYKRLLEKIISETLFVTNSDCGTLYLIEENSLKSKFMINKSLNVYVSMKEAVEFEIPLEEENICGCCVIKKKIINVVDIYKDKEFDFSRTKEYDKFMGYQTKSMLVIPLEDHENNVLGVIKLVNSISEDGKIIEFSKDYEKIAFSLASQASVSLANMRYIKEMELTLYSMVSVFTAAIDERTPYNANHTKNVAQYTDGFIEYINQKYKECLTDIYFKKSEKEQTVMAAMLHDIGKLVIPVKVMNKADKLGERYQTLMARMELIRAKIKIDFLEGRFSKCEWLEKDNYILESIKFIEKINKSHSIDEKDIKLIEELSKIYYEEKDGQRIYYINESEKDCLMIKKGTLTRDERKIMESHAEVTVRLLEKVHFGEKYSDVVKIAGKHHEFLDGSGYPNGLTAQYLPKEARMLVILDIFESLTSDDRPYKRALTVEQSFEILDKMAQEGKIDKKLLDLFKGYIKQKFKVNLE